MPPPVCSRRGVVIHCVYPNTPFPAPTKNSFIIYSLHLAQSSRLIVGLLLLANLLTPAGARHSEYTPMEH